MHRLSSSSRPVLSISQAIEAILSRRYVITVIDDTEIRIITCRKQQPQHRPFLYVSFRELSWPNIYLSISRLDEMASYDHAWHIIEQMPYHLTHIFLNDGKPAYNEMLNAPASLAQHRAHHAASHLKNITLPMAIYLASKCSGMKVVAQQAVSPTLPVLIDAAPVPSSACCRSMMVISAVLMPVESGYRGFILSEIC